MSVKISAISRMSSPCCQNNDCAASLQQQLNMQHFEDFMLGTKSYHMNNKHKSSVCAKTVVTLNPDGQQVIKTETHLTSMQIHTICIHVC